MKERKVRRRKSGIGEREARCGGKGRRAAYSGPRMKYGSRVIETAQKSAIR